MTVDLSKLKAGYTVKFRCGGEAVVYTNHNGRILFFDKNNDDYVEYSEGGFIGLDKEHPFDIIEIIPAAFDWDTVKYKDAFIKGYGSPGPVYFLCHDPADRPNAYVGDLVTKGNCLYNVRSVEKHELTRAHEHDIEVPG